MKTKADFEQAGLAAFLPGMQYMLDLMQSELDRMKQTLEALQAGETPKGRPPGRPKLAANLNQHGGVVAPNSYWGRMTPEERRAEARRRALVAQGKAKSQHAKPSMREKTDARERTGGTAAANWWAKASAAQKKKRLTAMAAARAKAQAVKANSAEVVQ